MRHSTAGVVALAVALAGCCFRGNAPVAPPADMRQALEAPASHSVLFDVAVIERPAGDAFLDSELWDLGNEQCIDLESKPLLEENGLRVGQLGGMLPPRLQALLTSKRSCPDPRRMLAEPESPTAVPVGPTRPKLAFEARQGGQGRKVELTEAACQLVVTPTPDGDALKLRFVPRVRHGKARTEPRVARDPDGAMRWSVEAKEPVEEFPNLAWEVTVAADEYVLVGPRRDQPGTLGSAFFFSPDGRTRKLLVLRAGKSSSGGVDETITQSPPLALQATWTARGVKD